MEYVRPDYPLSEVTNRIIGAAVEVHGTLGPGFREINREQVVAK